MANEKSVKLTITPRKGKVNPSFVFEVRNMERYEIIGILELALVKLKDMCLIEAKERFDN